MKITAQTFTGLVIGAVVTAGIILIIKPKPLALNFKSFRINGDALRAFSSGDFSKMNFAFANPSGTGIEVQPKAYSSANTPISIPRDLIVPLGRGASISGSKILNGDLYFFDRQHKQLAAILNLLPRGGYLELDAADYGTLDPSQPNYIYYNIKIYTSGGARVSSSIPRVVQLDPSPPAPPY